MINSPIAERPEPIRRKGDPIKYERSGSSGTGMGAPRRRPALDLGRIGLDASQGPKRIGVLGRFELLRGKHGIARPLKSQAKVGLMVADAADLAMDPVLSGEVMIDHVGLPRRSISMRMKRGGPALQYRARPQDFPRCQLTSSTT